MAMNYGDWTAAPTEAMTQFYAVKLNTTAKSVDLNDTAGERCIGIVQETITAGDVTNGRQASIRSAGHSRAVASAAVAAGAPVQASGDGRVVAAASGDFVLGFALTAAAAANDQIEIMVQPHAVPLA